MSTVSNLKSLFVRFFLILYVKLYLNHCSSFEKKDLTKNIYIVRLDNIGDLFLFLDAAYSLYNYYKNIGYNVIYITTNINKKIILHYKITDNFVVYDTNSKNNYKYNLKFLNSLTIFAGDILIVPIFSRTYHFPYAEIIYLFQNNDKIISKAFDKKGIISKLIYGILEFGVKEQKSIVSKNIIGAYFEYDYYAYLLNSNNIPLRNINIKNNILYKNTDKNKLITIFPTTSTIVKNWPEQYYYELIIKIISKHKFVSIYICGDKHINVLYELSQKYDNIEYRISKDDIIKTIEIIANSDLIISGDSAPIHISAKVGVPSICIMWGGSYGRFLPYSSNYIHANNPVVVTNLNYCKKNECTNICKYKDSNKYGAECINSISPEAIYNNIINIINI